MTDIKIRNNTVFADLIEAKSNVQMHVDDIVAKVDSGMREFLRDMQTELLESQSQLKKNSDEARIASDGNEPDKATKAQEFAKEADSISQKIREMKSGIATTEILLLRFEALQRKLNEASQKSKLSANALRQFEQIAMRYLNLENHNLASTKNYSSGVHLKNDKLRLVGDTFHFTKQDNNITQKQLQDMEYEIKNGRVGNKISIDGISQLDFSVLKSSGFTIQKIGPNDYSAYKMIEL